MRYHDSREVCECRIDVDLNDRMYLWSRTKRPESLPLVSVLDDHVYDVDRWTEWRPTQESAYSRTIRNVSRKELFATGRSRQQSWDTLRFQGTLPTATSTATGHEGGKGDDTRCNGQSVYEAYSHHSSLARKRRVRRGRIGRPIPRVELRLDRAVLLHSLSGVWEPELDRY